MIHRAILIVKDDALGDALDDRFDEPEEIDLPVPIWGLELGDSHAKR